MFCPPLPRHLESGVRRTEFLAGAADGSVVVIQNNADFVHQAHLLLVVTGEFAGIARGLCLARREDFAGERCVDLGEKEADVVGCDFGCTV